MRVVRKILSNLPLLVIISSKLFYVCSQQWDISFKCLLRILHLSEHSYVPGEGFANTYGIYNETQDNGPRAGSSVCRIETEIDRYGIKGSRKIKACSNSKRSISRNFTFTYNTPFINKITALSRPAGNARIETNSEWVYAPHKFIKRNFYGRARR